MCVNFASEIKRLSLMLVRKDFTCAFYEDIKNIKSFLTSMSDNLLISEAKLTHISGETNAQRL